MSIAFNSDIAFTRRTHAFSPSSLPHLEAGSSENPPTGAIDFNHTTGLSDGIPLMTEPSLIEREQGGHYDQADEGHPMDLSGVPVHAQHHVFESVPPQEYTHDGLVDRPTNKNPLAGYHNVPFADLCSPERIYHHHGSQHPLRNHVIDASSLSVGIGNTSFNMESKPSPPISSSSSSRDGNQVFGYGSPIPYAREMSSSQGTIEDYGGRFGIVPLTLPSYSSTHSHEYDDIIPHQDPLGEVNALQAHTHENHCHPRFSSLNQPQSLPALPNRMRYPYRTAHLTGIQDTYISSYSSLAEWNGVSNFTVANSGSIYTNLASLANPGGTVPAPAFLTPGHTLSLMSNPAYVREFPIQRTPHSTVAFPWVDGAQRSSSANPQIYYRCPEPSAGGDGLPVRGHKSPGNQRIGGNSPTEVAFVPPHGPPPSSSSSLQTLPTLGRISLPPWKQPCPYGPKYGPKLPCNQLTYSRHPFKHWLVHVRDQLEAIRTNCLKLQDGSIIDTSEKWAMAMKYISDFCPSCHKTFPGPKEVRNHVLSSPECSTLVLCKYCAPGAGHRKGCAECSDLLRTLILRSYVQVVKEIGYRHPGDPDLQNTANRQVVEWAVEQDLEKREYD
ncbi:hypothetical protein BU17DRAFT_84512 [Hysterangium stoloniferum]|nr:hypothetical protein BU17DRAFT_84512 [Hysterangium stoloniferum]